MISERELRSILQRGKSRDFYDVWRLLGEKGTAIDLALTRAVLKEKCRHIGIREPDAAGFLAPQQLEEARSYWERDLARQVAPACLPDWDIVTKQLTGLLARFFSS